jgi:hypothetical protein
MRRFTSFALGPGPVIGFAVPGEAAAKTAYVEEAGSDSATCGATPLTACRTVGAGVALTVNGDTVQVGPGNGQTLPIDTRTTKQGGVVGGGNITFTRNISIGGSGPVFASVVGLTITENLIEAEGGTRGLYLGGNEQDDVHVLRNTFNGFRDIGVYLRQANPGTPQNGDVELRQNTITNTGGGEPAFGMGILITNEGAAPDARVEIEHNRIVNNQGGGLIDRDPDAVIDARRNWWGCNAGPGSDPGSGAVAGDAGGRTPAFAPWMTLTLTATPMPQFAGDRSTLESSVEHLSDGSTPAGPFFLTGEASFGSTPAGTHTPPREPLVSANVSAKSAYAAGAEDPDELRTTVDNQTVRIKIHRPPAADVVPVLTPDDPALTPGEMLTQLVELINEGNKPAPRVRACLRLSEQLDPVTRLCRTVRKLDPGHGIVHRFRARVRDDACAGRLTHQLRVHVPGQRALVRRVAARLLAGPCRTPPCGARATASGAGLLGRAVGDTPFRERRRC